MVGVPSAGSSFPQFGTRFSHRSALFTAGGSWGKRMPRGEKGRKARGAAPNTRYPLEVCRCAGGRWAVLVSGRGALCLCGLAFKDGTRGRGARCQQAIGEESDTPAPRKNTDARGPVDQFRRSTAGLPRRAERGFFDCLCSLQGGRAHGQPSTVFHAAGPHHEAVAQRPLLMDATATDLPRGRTRRNRGPRWRERAEVGLRLPRRRRPPPRESKLLAPRGRQVATAGQHEIELRAPSCQ